MSFKCHLFLYFKIYTIKYGRKYVNIKNHFIKLLLSIQGLSCSSNAKFSFHIFHGRFFSFIVRENLSYKRKSYDVLSKMHDIHISQRESITYSYIPCSSQNWRQYYQWLCFSYHYIIQGYHCVYHDSTETNIQQNAKTLPHLYTGKCAILSFFLFISHGVAGRLNWKMEFHGSLRAWVEPLKSIWKARCGLVYP